MDDSLRDRQVEQVTIFESGYAFGFKTTEVRWIRFHVAPLTGGGDYDAATFVERGKRKENIVPLSRIVVLKGWDHPDLDAYRKEPRPGGTVAHVAKYMLFSKEWDQLLDEHIAGLKVIVDGRRIEGQGIRRGTQPVPRATGPSVAPPADDLNSARAFVEGAAENLLLDRYERDPAARRACIDHYGYGCQVCGLSMRDVYGERGAEFVHVHHRVPLSDIGVEHTVDPIRDLVPVCPNCHAMLHRTDPPASAEELADIVRDNRRLTIPPAASGPSLNTKIG